MKKDQIDQSLLKTDDMLKSKTNEDYNNQKPNLKDINQPGNNQVKTAGKAGSKFGKLKNETRKGTKACSKV